MPLSNTKPNESLRRPALLLILVLAAGTFLYAFLLPALSDRLAEDSPLAAILYYLSSLLSVAVLFAGAAGIVFGLINARFSFALLSSAALLFFLFAAELLPLLIAPSRANASLGEIFSSNEDALFSRAAFDFLRVVLIWAGALAGIAIAARAKKKQKKRAFFLAALFSAALLCLLPALTELFETTLPFLSAASRNRKNAELPKIFLEYFLYLLYGTVGFFIERAFLRLFARLAGKGRENGIS